MHFSIFSHGIHADNSHIGRIILGSLTLILGLSVHVSEWLWAFKHRSKSVVDLIANWGTEWTSLNSRVWRSVKAEMVQRTDVIDQNSRGGSATNVIFHAG